MDSCFGCGKVPCSAAERLYMDYDSDNIVNKLHQHWLDQRNKVFLPRSGERGRFDLERGFGGCFGNANSMTVEKYNISIKTPFRLDCERGFSIYLNRKNMPVCGSIYSLFINLARTCDLDRSAFVFDGISVTLSAVGSASASPNSSRISITMRNLQ